VQHVQKLLSTRGGTIAVSAFAALLAAVIFLVYLRRYQSSVDESGQPMTVFVAKNLIEKGTPGTVLASEDLYERTTVPREDLHEGAIADPNVLKGRVAVEDILPGDQLTTADFTAAASEKLTHNLTEYQRGIAVPLDAAHGLIGHVQTGDHVDVLVGFNVEDRDTQRGGPVLRVLMQDIVVLDAPQDAAAGGPVGAGGTKTSNVVLRMTDEQAAQLAFSSDNGKVWIVVRPKAGAESHLPSMVTVERLLTGVKPLPLSANGSRGAQQ
jgi:Flp pilus assembly protein CpaB